MAPLQRRALDFLFGRFLDNVIVLTADAPPIGMRSHGQNSASAALRESDVVESARIMSISWGGDHRAVDGATMARFGNLWKSYCGSPSSMMFAMR
jgi:2-oxoisovalerate dehydrogenase E2 component (dihydrolipoyl transacylase)